MKTIGLSVFDDSSAALIKDNKILFAIEEERINRIKHYSGIPYLSFEECLKFDKISMDEIDYIAVGWNPYKGWITRISRSLVHSFKSEISIKSKLKRGGSYYNGCRNIIRIRKTLPVRYALKEKLPPIKYISHHFAHAASVYFTSPYKVCNIIVADGIGESESISLFRAKDGKIIKIKAIKYPVSLGHLYAAVTGFLGFKMTSDEGKVMAMASYGRDKYKDVFEKILRLGESGKKDYYDVEILDYHSSISGQHSKMFSELSGLKPRKQGEPLLEQHFNLACSLQKHVERCVLRLLNKYFPDGKNQPLCAAGGFFLNSVTNGIIIKEFTDKFYVFPASGDNGVSAGAALYVNSLYGKIKPINISDAYCGNQYSEKDIEKAIIGKGLDVNKTDDAFSKAADLLSAGKIIGWYRGRMEFGPRALGNRSILADPKFEWIKDLVNSKVKHREYFRPFAAAVLYEEAEYYFDNFAESPYMLKVFNIKEKFKSIFPAICHVDGTCRVQTVRKENNRDLYELLERIKLKTGYGIILNTSMNDVGEPIVNTPDEAVNLFLNTNLDALIMENYIFEK